MVCIENIENSISTAVYKINPIYKSISHFTIIGVLIDASIWSKRLLSPRFLKTENIIRLLLSHAFVLVFQMETIESQNESFTELETSTTPNKNPNS